MVTVDTLLAQLDGVRPSGASGNAWLAKCPAHADRTASLSVGIGADARILLNCFAGCRAVDVLTALGMSFRDLYNAPLPGQRRRVGSGYQSLREIEHAMLTSFLILKRNALRVSPADQEKLLGCCARIGRALDRMKVRR